MQLETKDQERIRAYLLGRIAQADLPDLEQQLLVDAAFYEELSIVEDELIDEYIHGELPTSDRESFDSHFMSAPERREKLRFARALKKHVSAFETEQPYDDQASEAASDRAASIAEPPPKKSPFFSFLPFQSPVVSYALAAAILLMFVGVAWVVFRNVNPRPSGEVMAVTLTPGLTREVNEEFKKISISQNVGRVDLKLQIPGTDSYSRYRAELHEARGGKKFEANDLIASQTGITGVVTLPVAAQLLTNGDYYVKLSGLTPANEYEDVERYSFRVVRN